jgi:hypothetical protein
MNSKAIFLTLLFGFSSFAHAGSSYTILKGTSAMGLHSILMGPNVVTSGFNKEVVIDAPKGTKILCDSFEQICRVENTEFNPVENSDFEIKLELKGSQANALRLAIPGVNPSSPKNIGYLGDFGTAYLEFTGSSLESNKAQIYVSYCYQPGC